MDDKKYIQYTMQDERNFIKHIGMHSTLVASKIAQGITTREDILEKYYHAVNCLRSRHVLPQNDVLNTIRYALENTVV